MSLTDVVAGEMLDELLAVNGGDLEFVKTFLRDAARDPEQARAKYMRWRVMPVSVREFVTSPEYLNEPGTWPEVLAAIEEINSGRWVECVLTGAIGAGKTTIAVVTIAYQVYLLSCLRDPHAELEQKRTDEIVIVIQAITRTAAKEIGYSRLRKTIRDSPYFKNNFMFDPNLQSQMAFPRNIWVKAIAGNETAAIGQNVIGGILDEINFMKVVEKSKRSHGGNDEFDQAKKNYNSIAMRRLSRFQNKGFMPGMLCLVSSRNYPGQFTDEKEVEAREPGKKIYVYDKRLWEIAPWKFTEGRFRMFVGDATHKPRVLGDDEVVHEALTHLVMPIPTDLKEKFEKGDVIGALRDLAGVASTAIHPFILDREAIGKCFDGTVKNVLSRGDCDFETTIPEFYPRRINDRDRPRWMHYDPALTGDHGGLAIGYVDRFVNVKRGASIEILPNIVIDCLLDVAPPQGGEILFENIRELIYNMRSRGYNIQFISMDTFQSRDSLQQFERHRFKVGERSMDKGTAAYDVLKQAIYDGRVHIPKNERAAIELARIEINVKKRKIDHPPNGSKDLSDAIAGVVFGLTTQREVWVDHDISTQRMPEHVAAAVAEIKTEKNSVQSRAIRNRGT